MRAPVERAFVHYEVFTKHTPKSSADTWVDARGSRRTKGTGSRRTKGTRIQEDEPDPDPKGRPRRESGRTNGAQSGALIKKKSRARIQRDLWGANLEGRGGANPGGRQGHRSMRMGGA